MTIDNDTIIIVHTGETKTFHYNPATHGELREEMADGNLMLSVVPKEVLKEREQALEEVKRSQQ